MRRTYNNKIKNRICAFLSFVADLKPMRSSVTNELLHGQLNKPHEMGP